MEQSNPVVPKIHLELSIDGDIPNGWFVMENPIKMDDLGVPPPFMEIPICEMLED